MKILVIIPILPMNGDGGLRPSERAKKYVRPDTQVDAINIEYGPASIESVYDDTMAAPFVVKKAEWAEKNGYDAVVVSCMMDPGVKAAKEAVEIPVVGPREACMAIASVLGKNPKTILPRGIPVLQMHDDPERTYRALREDAERAIKEGAEVLVMGCTALSGIAERLNEELDVPVLENQGTALKVAEMLVDLKVTQSKKTYPKPPKKKRILPG
ncbi:MAG: aspartate/glutamate racemase family protein [Candidatus Bathyarchaeia archaeon]